MKQKLADEIARFNIFQRSVLGSADKIENAKDTDIRNYATEKKYPLFFNISHYLILL